MKIIYIKEGMRIIHSSGTNQFLTLEDLHRLWNQAIAREIEAEEYAEVIHDYIIEVEKHQ